MFNHAPENYSCPICLAIQGIESEKTMIKQADIFYRDELVLGFIGSKSIRGNEGHPLLVPVEHSENLYDLSPAQAQHILGVAQKIAIALKSTRTCDGVTLVQNNEPTGDQHAFHYHLHIVPRFTGDNFHQELFNTYVSDASDRKPFADALRSALS
jgi:histidine triad (HIT) family protein